MTLDAGVKVTSGCAVELRTKVVLYKSKLATFIAAPSNGCDCIEMLNSMSSAGVAARERYLDVPYEDMNAFLDDSVDAGGALVFGLM
jgi:hypothetical protein